MDLNRLRELGREFAAKWMLWLAVWTTIALCFGHQSFIHLRKAGTDPGWWKVIHWSLEDWYVWGLFSMGIFELARRFPLTRRRWPTFFLLHIATSLALSPVYQWLRTTVCGMDHIAWRQPLPDVIVYWIILTVWHANHWRRESQEEALRAAEMEHQMVQAQLLALRMQLNPHFLFNTLNAIANLLRRDLDAAERMIVRLSELLRKALDSSRQQEVALAQEMDFLSRYIELERLRFGDRLNYVCDIPEEASQAMIPNLILQPLVENAIKHGIENRSSEGKIEVKATRYNGSLRLEVRDNGQTSPGKRPPGQGVGLANTRARLNTLYGNHHRFSSGKDDKGGFMVSMEIPFRRLELESPKAKPVLEHAV